MFVFRRLYNLYLRNFRKFNYLGKNVVIEPFCDIPPFVTPYLRIEKEVYIANSAWFNIAPEGNLRKKPIITIGQGSQIGRRCTISGARSIEIRKKVMFAPNVFISDHLHEFSDKNTEILNQGITKPGKIIIEEGCWIGYNSAIIANDKELVIGKNSIVSANTVVTKSFPEYSRLMGVPARNIAKVLE